MIEQTIAVLAERLEANPPASPDQVKRAASMLGRYATADHLRFFESMDGAEGDAGGQFGYVQLWGVDDLEALNAAYCVDEFLSDVMLIGSDGGGEAFGVAVRDDHLVVINVPFTPMDDAHVRVIATSFADFLRQVGDVG